MKLSDLINKVRYRFRLFSLEIVDLHPFLGNVDSGFDLSVTVYTEAGVDQGGSV